MGDHARGDADDVEPHLLLRDVVRREVVPRDARDLACLSLGLEIPPFWRGEAGETYPVFLRTFKRAFSRALRQGIHEVSDADGAWTGLARLVGSA